MADETGPDPELQEESGELFEHFRFVVDKGQALLRIDRYLTDKIENATRNRLQNAAHAGNILVNDKPVKPNYRVKPLDVVTIVMAWPPRDTEIYPENIPFDIVFEDEDILVINKAAGMVVHPGHGNFTGTLQNAVLYHLQEQNNKLGTAFQPYLAHRIDKDTSGILLMAKNELAQSRLARQFFNHTINRTYQALVWGAPSPSDGTITGNILRDQRNRLVMTVTDDPEKGRHAVTHYRTLESFGYTTLIECRLETGRTHQIRVHLKHLGHPLFNDVAYGGNRILKGTTFSRYKQFIMNCFELMPRQALHAKSLGFIHPSTGKTMFFDTVLPPDFSSVVEKWRRYQQNLNEI